MTPEQWKSLKVGDKIKEFGATVYTIKAFKEPAGPTHSLIFSPNGWDYVSNCKYYELVEPEKPSTLLEGSAHYKKTKYQPLEVLLDWQDSWPVDVRFHLGCVLKYLGRMGKKDEAIMELKKIKHYAEEAIRVLELK